jgi:hypothetical protein
MARELIESLDPGAHQFIPCSFVLKDTNEPIYTYTDWYVFNCLNSHKILDILELGKMTRSEHIELKSPAGCLAEQKIECDYERGTRINTRKLYRDNGEEYMRKKDIWGLRTEKPRCFKSQTIKDTHFFWVRPYTDEEGYIVSVLGGGRESFYLSNVAHRRMLELKKACGFKVIGSYNKYDEG